MSFMDGTKITGTFLGDAKLLADPGNVHFFLKTLVHDIGMTSLGYSIYDVPMAVKRLGQDPLSDEGGVTGIAVLSTSHIAIHTWPEDSGARIDVDSCRSFDASSVSRLLQEFFKATAIHLTNVSHVFDRLHFKSE